MNGEFLIRIFQIFTYYSSPHILVFSVGEFRLPHARTGGVLIFAHRRVKHTDTIFNVVRQNRLHPRERVIVLEIEKGLQ
jgi:hypothetical protein